MSEKILLRLADRSDMILFLNILIYITRTASGSQAAFGLSKLWPKYAFHKQKVAVKKATDQCLFTDRLGLYADNQVKEV